MKREVEEAFGDILPAVADELISKHFTRQQGKDNAYFNLLIYMGIKICGILCYSLHTAVNSLDYNLTLLSFIFTYR